MKRYIEGQDRGQESLLPEHLDDYVTDDNPWLLVHGSILSRVGASTKSGAVHTLSDLGQRPELLPLAVKVIGCQPGEKCCLEQ